jgi:hypothetical protein
VLLAITFAGPAGTGVNAFTYDGVSFSTIGGAGSSSAGNVVLLGIPDVPGGSKEVVLDITGTLTYITANTISYTGVSGVALAQSTTGTGAALTQAAACVAGQLIVQAFATGGQSGILGGFSGGTERYYGDVTVSGLDYAGLVISDATSSATFEATDTNPSAAWAGMAVVLNPALSTVLASAAGGVAGGPGGGFNPANSNTTSTGMTAGNETWPTSGPGKRTFYGGPSTTTTHLPGNAPGGGSAGGDATFPPEDGADGAVYITARQS